MTVRAIEFLGGGPLDGEARLVDDEMETAVILDGLAIHVYQREEVFDGPSVREIMRWIRQVPIGNRRLPTD
jgi:hypothetical protein